ncbi:MAG: DNA polymerase III subunit gamma/tau, partial [Chloroflexota bacterium]
MASQALYRKWRSQTFDEVIGQQHVTQTLINALELDRVAHAYLFSGPRGTGKTSTARLLAKAVNCQHEDLARRPCNECHICLAINEGRLLDLIEIDAASNTGVDDIRDLRDKVNFRPAEAQIKFYIIDEVHMLSNSAFNALLKTLEEPPAHVIFVLATTEPEKIPATITSRCQRFDFKRIKLDDIVGRLAYIAEQESIAVEGDALEYIARQGGGSMRDAISVLDQLTAYGSEQITLELVQNVLGAVASQSVVALVEAIIDQDIAAGLDIINQMVSDGSDPRQLAREMVEYLRSLMLVKLGNGAETLNLPVETLTIMKQQAAKADAAAIVQATSLFNTAVIDIKSGLLTIPQLPLELAFVESATPSAVQAAPTVAAVAAPLPLPAAAPPRSAPAKTAPSASPADQPPPVRPKPAVGDLTIEP